MDKVSKYAVINTFEELFYRGEILKAQKFLAECLPLWLEDDPHIAQLRDRVDSHVEKIKSWSVGRPYPGSYAIDKAEKFPKFPLAKKKILEQYQSGSILDVGCYAGIFVREMAKEGFQCTGTDVYSELMELFNKESGGNPHFEFAAAESLPFPSRTFDVVTAFDVLEHVIDFQKALFEIESVAKLGALIIINVPRMTPGYKDEALEHVRMFGDKEINRIWGKRQHYTFELCKDELGRDTSFITYRNG